MTHSFPAHKLAPAGPCRAQDKTRCRYHGAFIKLQEAVATGDADTYLTARSIIEAEGKKEFGWLNDAISILAKRPVGRQFFTKDEVKIRLIAELTQGVKYQSDLLRSQDALDGEDPYNEGWRDALLTMSQYLTDQNPRTRNASIHAVLPAMSPHLYSRHYADISNEASDYARENLGPRLENTVKGKVQVSGTSEWVDAQVYIRPTEGKLSGEEGRENEIWVSYDYVVPSGLRKGQDANMGGRYESVDFFLEVNADRVSPEVKEFALNGYNPDSTEETYRDGYITAISEMETELQGTRVQVNPETRRYEMVEPGIPPFRAV